MVTVIVVAITVAIAEQEDDRKFEVGAVEVTETFRQTIATMITTMTADVLNRY